MIRLREVGEETRAMKVVEELCDDVVCPRGGTHWHLLNLATFATNPVGEYTITVRVREVGPRPTRRVSKTKLLRVIEEGNGKRQP